MHVFPVLTLTLIYLLYGWWYAAVMEQLHSPQGDVLSFGLRAVACLADAHDDNRAQLGQLGACEGVCSVFA